MSVKLDSVGHRYAHGPWLFTGVTQTINPGEVVALVGPSGSGKSTLLAIIAGWLVPAAGSVALAEADSHAADVAWVFQNPHGNAHRSVIDHVALPLLAQGLAPADADARALRLLTDFGLDALPHRPFHTLSGGEAQRMLLARGLASDPAVLLVDEPTAQLDQRTARRVADALTALKDRGIVVIIATHDPHVRDQCTRVIDLADHTGMDADV